MVTYGINYECNNNCVMCSYLMPFPKKFEEFKKRKAIETFDKHIAKMKNLDTITITGGEPTLRKDLFNILKHVRDSLPDARIVLLSNGRMFFYEEYVRKLVQTNLSNFEIDIPLHASTSKIHDMITGVSGSFDQTVQGIKNLLKNNIDVKIRVVIHRVNYKDLPNLVNFIDSNFLGTKKVLLMFALFMGNAFKNRDKVMISYKEVMPWVEKAINSSKKNKVELYHFPLCVLKTEMRNFSRPTLESREIMHISSCLECKKKENCVGIPKTYGFNIGVKEFRAI